MATPISDAARLDHLRWMILARATDDRLAALYRQGHIRGGSVFVGRGQEALSAAIAMQLRAGDYFSPLIRDAAGRLVQGEPLLDVFRTHFGRRTGPMRGREGNIHRGSVDRGQLPMISHLGSSVGPLSGILMAKRIKGGQRPGDLDVAVASLGDGTMNTGAAHEGLNIAGVERLPLIAVVADNQVAYSTFSDRTYACRSLVDRAAGYGFRGHRCDGTDAEACLQTCAEAVARARAGEGPQMVVATLLRLSGHGEHDDASYVTNELRSRFGDCVQLAEAALRGRGLATREQIESWWEDARTRIQAALAQAQSEPEPDPAAEDWCALSERRLTGFRA